MILVPHKYKLSYVFISFWAPSPYKPVFKSEFYSWVCSTHGFVTPPRVIGCSSLSMGSNELRFSGWILEGTTIG